LTRFAFRLKLVSASAVYALSHLKPIREASSDLRSRLGGAIGRLPADLSEPVRRLLEDERLAEDMLKATAQDLARLRKELRRSQRHDGPAPSSGRQTL
jgi:hypothetical protein